MIIAVAIGAIAAIAVAVQRWNDHNEVSGWWLIAFFATVWLVAQTREPDTRPQPPHPNVPMCWDEMGRHPC